MIMSINKKKFGIFLQNRYRYLLQGVILEMSGRSRRWCFTLNNYTPEEYDAAVKFDNVRYLIVGEEVGENGTPHLQGYVGFRSPMRLRSVRTFLPRAHFEIARGTEKQNYTYCSKDGKFREVGSISEQGKRSDLLEMKEAIDNGESFEELWERDFDLWSGITEPSRYMLTLSDNEGMSLQRSSSFGDPLELASLTPPSPLTWSPFGSTLDEDGLTDTEDSELQFSMSLTDLI